MSISTGTQLSPVLRIGSAALIAFAAIAILRLLQRDDVPWWGWCIMGIVLVFWCGLFGYAAIVGRAPSWFVYTPPNKSGH